MTAFLNEKYFNNANFKLVLEYDTVMNQLENYHDVTYYLYFQSLNGYSGSGDATLGYINNSQVGSTTSISKNSKLLLGTKTERIYHNETNQDGTKSINYSASISCPWSNLGTASVSGTLILPKINRASTWDFSVNELQMSNIEDTLILKFTKYNSNYKNKITISNLQNTEIVKTIDNVENNYSLTFSNEELEQLYTLDTNSEKTNLRFYLNLYTYDSLENQIGEVQRTMMNAYLLDATPTFTYTIEETNDKVIDLLNSNSADTIIKSASKPKVTVNATASKGSTISTISIINSTQANANENPYIFENVETGTFTIVVTDSRGLTKTQTVTKNLINYTEIYINDFSFKRASQTSSNIILNADITCFKGSFNSIQNTPQLFYKVGTNNEYVEITSGFTFENNKIKFVDYDMGAILPYNETNTIYLYVLDLLTEDTENYPVSKGIATFEAGEHDFQVNGDLYIADTNRETKINVKEKIDKKYENKYMTAYIKTNQGITNMSNVFLDTVLSSNTSELSLSEGGIKIGDNVNRVEVSANLFTEYQSQAGYVWFQIRRVRGTGESLVGSFIIPIYNPSMVSHASGAITAIQVDVQKNDVLKIVADSVCGGQVRGGYYNTYMSAKII